MKIVQFLKFTNFFPSLLLTMSIIAPELAIAQPTSVDPQAGAQRSDEASVDTFLERKRREQQNREAALSRRSANAETAQLKALYRAAAIIPPGTNGRISPAKMSMLTDSLETDSLQLLQALNFKPGNIQQMVKSGANPLLAASNFIRGNASLQEQALLADITLIARVSAIANERIGDGFRSTVTLQQVEILAGRAPKSDIALRQASGLDSDGSTVDISTDLHPNVGDVFLLMVSSALYGQVLEEGGFKPAGKPLNAYILFGSAYQVDGDRLTSVNLGATADVSLTQFRSDISIAKNAKLAVPGN